MGHKRQTAEDTHENLCELLDWQFAERNDQAVAQALRSGQGVDTVYGLDEAGLLDGFFAFLEGWTKHKIGVVLRHRLTAARGSARRKRHLT